MIKNESSAEQSEYIRPQVWLGTGKKDFPQMSSVCSFSKIIYIKNPREVFSSPIKILKTTP